MTADQLADLQRQRDETWQRGGDGGAPHNRKAAAARAKREARHRQRRRSARRVWRDVAGQFNAGRRSLYAEVMRA